MNNEILKFSLTDLNKEISLKSLQEENKVKQKVFSFNI